MHLLDFVEGGDHQDDGYAGAEYQGEGGDENGDQGQGEEERYGQDEDVDVQERRRRRRPQKDRRPYTITMAIRKTNWFESSMEWEDDHFRTEYRSVILFVIAEGKRLSE
ncbi:hypothetical protein FRC12_007628 [Ceratobasidium sp. 428]|nr:hypothetical protein FRC12_007628 [Ceratobasidium sp. 428]